MLNLIMKIFICTIALFFADSVLDTVYFSHAYQPIVIGVTLALAGHLLEVAILHERTFWLTLLADFVTSALLIYFISYFFATAAVTWSSSLLVAAALGVIEYFVHRWLLRSGRARKEPTLG